MLSDQVLISLIFVITLVMFAFSNWRYDIVSIASLILATLLGLVDTGEMFSGFGHPAVITVAVILIISNALQDSGTLEPLTVWLRKQGSDTSKQILLLSSMVAFASAFMNNVGALALFLPIVITLAKRKKIPASRLLMPVSFASLLGGLVTLIGTPPNIIISNYLEKETGQGFQMFDFAPVGFLVALAGIAYMAFIGWRFVPERSSKSEDSLTRMSEYMTELRVPEGNELHDRSLYRVLQLCEGDEVSILSIIRGSKRILAPSQYEILKENDILVVEGQTQSIQHLLEEAKLEIVNKVVDTKTLSSESVEILEVVVAPSSQMTGFSTERFHLFSQYGVNLLGISRQGHSITQRLHKTIIRAGDVLLLQADKEGLSEKLEQLGCLPLAERSIHLGKKRKVWTTLIIFMSAILLTSVTSLPPQLTFTMAVGFMILTHAIDVQDIYSSVEIPIIVLLACMIPLGQALETTGVTSLIATTFVTMTSGLPVYVMLAILILICMLLSDVINNAATAVIMAPIGSAIAMHLGYNLEPFLMAICIGSSSTYLTPIGHQSNLLVMSPGGYRFSDYMRAGWLLDIIIIVVSVPAILYFWPL